MEFGVLGTFQIVDGDQVRQLSAGGELAVLALLVLNAGRVVTTDALIDASWGERPPANPINALQVRVSKLRRALQTAGVPDSLLVTRRPGYLLDIDSEHVDGYRFVRLVDDARRAAEQDADRATRLYVEALGLWRGPVLPEFAGQPWAVPEITRLSELRMAATEERLDLELSAGRHDALVSELKSLVAAHPLRERLHGQLMLTLYRCGRQADALAAYQRTRRVLDDELGLDPSTELRSLEQAILRQDPKIAAPTRQTTTIGSVRLPARLSSFIGRTRELTLVRELMAQHRLVTLTGPGGVGKTSLALEAARGAVDPPDGVWLVQLAGVTDAARLPAAVVDALGLREDATVTAQDRLVAHLRNWNALLVLDNCEHLADGCAALAERLLEGCSRLRLLTTSREPLAIAGEVQCAVAPLDTPPADAAPAELSAYDAVTLLVDRASKAVPGFALDSHSAPHVLAICRQLDGIPLAIELAAARVKTLPVDDLAARLQDRFRVLTAGPRTADERQRTLRGAVDWSHRLLSEPERVLFRRLAVFRGGWTLPAAQDVCACPDLPGTEVYEVLAHLVDRSMVVADHGEGPRFHLLETLRQYASERLAESGEAQRVTAAHAKHFTTAAERTEPQLRGPDQGRLLDWLRTERDNLDSAMSWCLEHTIVSPDLGLRLVAALGWFWYFASRQDGGDQVAAMVTAARDGAPGPRARALLAQSVAGRPGACIVHPNPGCAAAAQQSLDLFQQLGDTDRAAYSQTLLAVEGVATLDFPGSLAMTDAAEAHFAAGGDRWGQALASFVRMELHFAEGASDAATASARHALKLFRDLGDHWGISAIQYHLGLALHRIGQWADALRVYEGALAEGRQVGLANTVQYTVANMGLVTLALGDAERAERCFAEAHVAAQQLGAGGNPVAALGEGLLARHRGDTVAARGHYAQAQAWAQHKPDWTSAALCGLGFIAELTGDLDEAEALHRRAWQSASGTHAAAGPAAAALEGLACVAAARGDAHKAASLLGAAHRWRQAGRSPATPAEQRDIDRAADHARRALSEHEYQAAYQAVSLQPEALIADLTGQLRC